ncbi:site-specific integrase [Microvirga sp. 0TCS3.31]
MNRRRGQQLPPAWATLWAFVSDETLKKRLGSLIKYCSAQDVRPEDVGEPILDAFLQYRQEETPQAYGVSERRQVARAWNTCTQTIAGWPKQHLVVPPDQRYKGPAWTDFPETLQTEVEAYFASISRQSRLRGSRRTRSCSPRTTKTRRREFIAFAGKAVAVGYAISSLTSLSVLLQPALVEQVVNAYWDGDGEKPKTYTVDLPWRLFVIARESQCLDADTLRELADLRSAAQQHRPKGLTEKNRAVIRAVKSTKAWANVCSLPQQLMTEARRQRTTSPHKAAVKAQIAVAIAVLTMAPVRIGNLVGTKLDQHLFRVGGPSGRFWLEYEPHEVKNNVDLQFSFDQELTDLLTEYIEVHRPVLLRGSNEDWLFPGVNGGSKAPHLLSAQIRDLVEKRTGLRVTAHQFRHVAAAMLLMRSPGNYPLVAKVLGHKGTATTMNSYIGLESLDATELFAVFVRQLQHSHQTA